VKLSPRGIAFRPAMRDETPNTVEVLEGCFFAEVVFSIRRRAAMTDGSWGCLAVSLGHKG
jgi:hypothetical protein